MPDEMMRGLQEIEVIDGQQASHFDYQKKE
jgi:hypothetical protein